MRTQFGLLLGFWLLGGGVAFAQQGTDITPPPSSAPEVGAGLGAEAINGPFDNNYKTADKRIWFNSEYLLWWVKNGPLPVPLVTYGSDADAPLQGVIGQPGTRVAFGGSGLDFGAASGLRLSAGLALTADGQFSLEGGWLGLERRSVSFNAASNGAGAPVIARPFLNAVGGAENAELDSSSLAGIAGGVSVYSSSRFQGWEINFAVNGQRQAGLNWSGLVGFRALDLQEGISLQDSFRDITGVPGGAGLTFLGAPVMTSAAVTDLDSFSVHNQFWGPQIGGRLEWTRDIWTVNLVGKVALGCSQEMAVISGATTAVVNPGDARTTAVGGVLTQTSNIGRYFRNAFAVVPETGLNLTCQLTPGISAHVGYDFLYWSNVLRPGDTIDRTVNHFVVPSDPFFGTGTGPARPAFSFQSTSYWAQGISFGLEFKY
jgi:hypothetical protein